MIPYLLHIYGPFYLNSYGLMIACGVLITFHLLKRDPLSHNLVHEGQLAEIFFMGIVLAIVGGRLLWIASNLPMPIYECFEIWEGGLSSLGSLIMILAVMPIYFRRKGIPTIPFLDLISTYAPLLQAVARIGCFLAGCCYGLPTDLPWGIHYTHPDIQIPQDLKCLSLHPTQLYSSLFGFGNFLLIYYFGRAKLKQPGQLTGLYLCLSSIERIVIDFWRADREFLNIGPRFLSIHQILAHILLAIGVFLILRPMLFNIPKNRASQLKT